MRNKLIYFFVYQIALLTWSFKLHNHYFEFATADQAGLTFTALLPLVLLRFDLQISRNMLWIFPVATPLLLFPIVDFTIAYFSDIWILLYLLLSL